MKFISTLFFIFSLYVGFAQEPETLIGKTQYFEFHSSFWVNLHHFLYQQAKGDQAKHLAEDGYELMDIGDTDRLKNLSEDQQVILQKAIDYYKENLIDKRLIFELADMTHWLQSQPQSISDTTYSATFSNILNAVSVIYRNHFWRYHQKQNARVLDLHLGLIKKFEGESISKLEQLADNTWPEESIRIDLTAYANWAGAYTYPSPAFNIFISTLDPFAPKPDFIETVFHESSHLLFSRNSGFRSGIYFISKEQNIKFPRQLWHASLFYLCGRLIQDQLKEEDINHKLAMNTKSIFSDFNNQAFRDTLEAYYQGELDMDQTIRKLLTINY